MRQKLEDKKKKRKEHTSSKSGTFVQASFVLYLPLFCLELKDDHLTSVEELLAFIEGGDGDEGELSKASKRQRKKQKKVP